MSDSQSYKLPGVESACDGFIMINLPTAQFEEEHRVNLRRKALKIHMALMKRMADYHNGTKWSYRENVFHGYLSNVTTLIAYTKKWTDEEMDSAISEIHKIADGIGKLQNLLDLRGDHV